MKNNNSNILLYIGALLLIICIFFAIIHRVEYEVVGTFSYVVSENQTLWDIASEYKPDGMDIREYIFELRKLNNLDDATIYPNQELTILQMKEVRR